MTEVLERGNVYFLYRPRVGKDEVEGPEDVQRFHMILDPHGKDLYRRMIIGRKRLPPIRDGGGKEWGFVEQVTRSKRRVSEGLAEETYTTKTRGEREVPAARPAAEGVYVIAKHDDHTHFAYALELPEAPGEVQKELQIHGEASHILTVKNPARGAPPGVGLPDHEQADYPTALQDRFGGRRFAPADPPDFLDHEGTEFLLIGARKDAEEELGVDLNPQQEDEHSAEILRKLRLPEEQHPREPLLRGSWR